MELHKDRRELPRLKPFRFFAMQKSHVRSQDGADPGVVGRVVTASPAGCLSLSCVGLHGVGGPCCVDTCWHSGEPVSTTGVRIL